jgi:TonB family protein
LKNLIALGVVSVVLPLGVYLRHSFAHTPKPVITERHETPSFLRDLTPDYDPNLVKPVFLSKPTPKYTVDALEHRVQGVVTVYVFVLKDGNVEVTGIENKLGHGLDEEAIRVAKAARFKPAISHGHLIVMQTPLYVDFRLTRRASTACFKAGDNTALVAPIFISKPNPKFTPEALEHRVQGVIALYVLVHRNGKVDVTGAENQLGFGLDEEAVRVGKQARFRPGTSHGRPVEWHHVLYVDFRLPQEVASR